MKISTWITLMVAVFVISACTPVEIPETVIEVPETVATTAPTEDATETTEGFTLGMVLVGPINDGGWSQAHYEGGRYVEANVPNSKFVYVDRVNPADRPNVTVEQIVDELVAQGADLVVTNSADFQDGTNQAALNHPDVKFVHISGDAVLLGTAPENVSNLMGEMEYGKMIAGCAAALETQTGKIGYVGPLINGETRRLVNAAYLGAKHCWQEYRQMPVEDLSFKVTWIGFWFNIPGVTLDPTKVANDFISEGRDVLMSGIDTTEAVVEANKATQAGNRVMAIPYDHDTSCELAPEICLGVPYFNWGPEYVKLVNEISGGAWEQKWDLVAPYWADMNNKDMSVIGFVEGKALSATSLAALAEVRTALSDGSLNLYTGPLVYQDGTVFLNEGETAQVKDVWATPMLFEGIEGLSAQ